MQWFVLDNIVIGTATILLLVAGFLGWRRRKVLSIISGILGVATLTTACIAIMPHDEISRRMSSETCNCTVFGDDGP